MKAKLTQAKDNYPLNALNPRLSNLDGASQDAISLAQHKDCQHGETASMLNNVMPN